MITTEQQVGYKIIVTTPFYRRSTWIDQWNPLVTAETASLKPIGFPINESDPLISFFMKRFFSEGLANVAEWDCIFPDKYVKSRLDPVALVIVDYPSNLQIEI